MQIKSKARVAEHGEVFTNPREVSAMLDLAGSAVETENARILEPACGAGAFLDEILARRLERTADRYKNQQADYEFYALLSLGSLYGIDILEDNASAACENLLALFASAYKKLFKSKVKQQVLDTARYIAQENIVWGDALRMERMDAAEQGADKGIIFAQWEGLPFYRIQKRSFVFRHMFDYAPMEQGTLFSSDMGEDIILPQPVGEEEHYYLAWGAAAPSIEAKNYAEQRELF